MPTSWKRADVNALHAHLQEALAEREASTGSGDWSYSDYEVEAIRAELHEREMASASAQKVRVTDELPDTACRPRVDAVEAGDPDLDRIRVLIARCFTPTRRSTLSALGSHAHVDAVPRLGEHRRHGKPSMHRFARLQRLL
jgi:hypothetical protein